MLERANAVVFLASSIDACALWRLYLPYLSMPGSSFFCFRDKIDFGLIAENDICIVQRCCTQPQLEFLKVAVQLGLKVVYDLDDDVWNLPSYNPARAVLEKYKEGFGNCIRMVDVVTVSTFELAKMVRKNVRGLVSQVTGRPIPIVVAENHILEKMFVRPERPDTLTIGWAGSSSHIGDLALVEPGLLAAAAERPDITIEFRGCDLPAEHPLRKLENFHHYHWKPVPSYASRMPIWRWSIALAPVTDHPFNDSKSSLKMIEAGYCGIPCLASWVRPYEEFCHHDPELKWLLCLNAASWEKKIRELMNDHARREFLGARMRAVVRKHYTFDGPHLGWQEALRLARGGAVEGRTTYVVGGV
jgi:glycosyltransferase involved in cell wall biosynthesis